MTYLRQRMGVNRPSWSAQLVPMIGINVRLVEDAAQSAHRDFALLRHNRRVDGFVQPPDELHVAALLAGFNEACRLKPALDLTEGLGLKPPQPRPRWCEPWADGLRSEARSRVPALPLGSRGLLLPSPLGWQHRPPGIGKHTNRPHARQLPRTVASWANCCTPWSEVSSVTTGFDPDPSGFETRLYIS